MNSFVWELSCSTLTGGRAGRQIDATKPIVGFCSFANSPKNGCFSYRIHRKNKIFVRISGVWGVKSSEIVGGQRFSTVIGVYPPPLPSPPKYTDVWKCSKNFEPILITCVLEDYRLQRVLKLISR